MGQGCVGKIGTGNPGPQWGGSLGKSLGRKVFLCFAPKLNIIKHMALSLMTDVAGDVRQGELIQWQLFIQSNNL